MSITLTSIYPSSSAASSGATYTASNIVFEIEGANSTPFNTSAALVLNSGITATDSGNALQTSNSNPSQYLQYAASNNSLSLSSYTAWTIECLFNAESYTSGEVSLCTKSGLPMVSNKATTEYVLFYDAVNGIVFGYYDSVTSAFILLAWKYTIVANVDYYLAIVKNGSSITAYVNGNSQGTLVFTGAMITTSNSFYVFGNGEDSHVPSIIRGLRITKVALSITSNAYQYYSLTPSLSPVDLYLSKVILETYGSSAYPVNGDTIAPSISSGITGNQNMNSLDVSGTGLIGLDYGNSNDYQLQSNWTVELYVSCTNWTASGAVLTFLSKCQNLSRVEYAFVYTGGNFCFYYSQDGQSAAVLTFTTVSLTANTKYYVAYVGSGTAVTLYLNGVAQGTQNMTLTGSATTVAHAINDLRIGGDGGYIAKTGGATLSIYGLRYTNGATRAITSSTYPIYGLTAP